MRADPGLAPFFGMLIAVLLNPTIGSAQTCEALPVDETSPLRYQFRAGVPRCEGMYRSLVSGSPTMRLVSLTFGRVTYDPKHDQYLEIRLPAESEQTTLLQAVGIPERLYYRLDADLGRGKSVFRLPLGDVIARENILPERFGIYAVRKLPGNENGFVPVHAHNAGAAAEADVIAVMRPGVDITDVQWRRYAPGAPVAAWTPVAAGAGLVPEGTPLEIVLKGLLPQTILEVSFLYNGIYGAARFVLLAR